MKKTLLKHLSKITTNIQFHMSKKKTMSIGYTVIRLINCILIEFERDGATVNQKGRSPLPYHAGMMKLADIQDLKSWEITRVGSNPTTCTNEYENKKERS